MLSYLLLAAPAFRLSTYHIVDQLKGGRAMCSSCKKRKNRCGCFDHHVSHCGCSHKHFNDFNKHFSRCGCLGLHDHCVKCIDDEFFIISSDHCFKRCDHGCSRRRFLHDVHHSLLCHPCKVSFRNPFCC